MSLLLQSGRRAAPQLLQRVARAFSAQAAPAGGGAAPAGSDIVLDSFREQQKQIRELMEGMKSIPVPLSGDPAAVKKFAADVEALKRRAGVPDEAELEAALVSFRLKSSGGDLRKALAGLTPDDADLDSALTALLEQAERESGGALTDANAKGWSLLASKVQALAKSKGLEDVAKVKAEATVKMYADALASLREGAADAVSAAARRDGLEGVVSVDAAALKPKW